MFFFQGNDMANLSPIFLFFNVLFFLESKELIGKGVQPTNLGLDFKRLRDISGDTASVGGTLEKQSEPKPNEKQI